MHSTGVVSKGRVCVSVQTGKPAKAAHKHPPAARTAVMHACGRCHTHERHYICTEPPLARCQKHLCNKLSVCRRDGRNRACQCKQATEQRQRSTRTRAGHANLIRTTILSPRTNQSMTAILQLATTSYVKKKARTRKKEEAFPPTGNFSDLSIDRE